MALCLPKLHAAVPPLPRRGRLTALRLCVCATLLTSASDLNRAFRNVPCKWVLPTTRTQIETHRAVPRSRAPAKIGPSGTQSLKRWHLFGVRTLLEVSLTLESATFGRPEVAPAGAPPKSCQRLRDWAPQGLILAGARLRGTVRCERLTENAK
jgi:hypothetical protein